VVTVAAQPVERTTEYIGTLKSRRSTTIQPQVEGFITRIAVGSGDRASPGALLFEIDAGRQEAMVAQLESMRTMRAADLAYARQQAERARALYAAGAVSQRDLEQAETSVRTSEAQVQAVEQQIKEQRVELGYYRVTAPAAGIVGDIPVRVGDRVTRSTVLTTVDQNDVLEIYVNVPVQQAPDLRLGLPVRIVDDTGGTLATNPITFISPTVDDTTQSVLAKAQLVEGRGRFRADQFVRTRIVWRSTPAITVPLTAVTRISGQHFVFVAEKQGEMLVARQRAVTLGDVVGNEYVLVAGLKAGEQLIVSGIQKIGDGAPVQVMPAAPAQRTS
jgi:RND family efflux transporter MFP subunit